MRAPGGCAAAAGTVIPARRGQAPVAAEDAPVRLAKKLRALAEEADHEGILAMADKAIGADPRMAAAHAARSRALWAMDRPDEAAEAIRTAVGLGPSGADELALCADAYYWGDDYKESARYCAMALELDPGDEVARALLINALAGADAPFGDILECCDGGIERNPTSTRFWAEKADRLLDMGRLDEAMACADEGIKGCGTGVVPGPENSLYATKALALRSLDRHEEAVKVLDEAIGAGDDGGYVRACRSDSLYKLGRHEEALEGADEAVKRMRYSAYTQYARVGPLIGLGRLKEALKGVSRVLELDPRMPEAAGIKAYLLAELGRPGEALEIYDGPAGKIMGYVERQLGRATALSRMGLHAEAAKSCAVAARRSPGLALLHHARGVELAEAGQDKKAVRSFRRSLKIDPGMAISRAAMASSLLALGRYAEAFRAARRAVTGDDTGIAQARVIDAMGPSEMHKVEAGRRAYIAQARVVGGIALERMGRGGDSLAWFNGAIRADPKNWHGYMGRAGALYRMGRAGAALRCCDRAVEAGASPAYAYEQKAKIFSNLGRHKESLASIDKALGIEPDNAGMLITRANALSSMDRVEEAEECVSRAIGLEQGNVEALTVKAALLVRLGRTGEAQACVDRAISVDPHSADAHAMGVFSVIQTDPAEAVQRWVAAKKACPGIAGLVGEKIAAHMDAAAEAAAGRRVAGGG